MKKIGETQRLMCFSFKINTYRGVNWDFCLGNISCVVLSHLKQKQASPFCYCSENVLLTLLESGGSPAAQDPACHQPCTSLLGLLAVRRCWWETALQAQLQNQIYFLSIMHNYGAESGAVYMLSSLGVKSWWEMSHSVCADTSFMIRQYLNAMHRRVF